MSRSGQVKGKDRKAPGRGNGCAKALECDCVLMSKELRDMGELVDMGEQGGSCPSRRHRLDHDGSISN